MRPARESVLALLLLLVLARPVAALEPPELRRYVTDLAGVLSQGDTDRIEQLLRQYDESTSNQFVVLVVPSLEGEAIEDFSMRVAEKNLVGQKGKDNGLLLLVAVQDRKIRLEVGYGLEPVLTDAVTSLIISDVIAPQFRAGNYAQGIYEGVNTAIRISTGEFTVSERSPRREKKEGGNLFGLIVFLVIMYFVIKGNKRGGRGGGIWFIGPFGGGGGFGGGGFGGGGGFSGFSGGGGGFGGGGSSGSW